MNTGRMLDYLEHIRQAAADACSFVDGMNMTDFLADKRTQQAVIMNLIIIGEAATKLLQEYPDYVEQHANIPWRSMKGMRNRIAHGYFEINLEVVWETTNANCFAGTRCSLTTGNQRCPVALATSEDRRQAGVISRADCPAASPPRSARPRGRHRAPSAQESLPGGPRIFERSLSRPDND